MMLPVTAEDLDARRSELQRTPALQALAQRLRQLLNPLLGRSIYLPEHKALLSVDGGRCPQDGTRLTFNPLSPHAHTCPRCQRTFTDQSHDRHWIWPYHLWLSERAIHLGLLGSLTGEAVLFDTARSILHTYARRYPDYPNLDNVLGPTRLFFSTYLESIWLVQIIIAALLAADTRSPAFDAMVDESAELIGSFDEGFSNRQVWNNAALVAAGRWLHNEELLERALDGPHGLRAQLRNAVTEDGLWFEGENYHFFALRGVLLAAELLRPWGCDLYADPDLGPRLEAMYEAPLLTVLPDLTLPARGNAPYGVSILQPRFAELWEIGWARTGSTRLESVLTRLYATDAAQATEGGFADIAEQEHNRPAQRLDRTLLGWKALLWMRPSAPQASATLWQRGSCLLPHVGLAVLRPAPGRYLSVECGERPGGHGHPDLLHLTLFWNAPILIDPGTGSYVSRQLHWYRSTLAHNAPGVAGVGQLSRFGWCAAFESADSWGWCRVIARDLVHRGGMVVRTVVLGPRYVLDVVEVCGAGDTDVDLPLHALPKLDAPHRRRQRTRLPSDGPLGHEHGYDALGDVYELSDEDDRDLVFACGDRLTVHVVPREGEKLFLAHAPGPSDARFAEGVPTPFLIRRAAGSGVWVQCYVPTESPIRQVIASRHEVQIVDDAGATDRIVVGEAECCIVDGSGNVFQLHGALAEPGVAPAHAEAAAVVVVCPRLPEVPRVEEWMSYVPTQAVTELGARHYRRSELAYGQAGHFAARVAAFIVGERLCFAADVIKTKVHFRREDAVDPRLDNEVADIHSDGVQCYWGYGGWHGYLAVPDPRSETVRIMAVAGTSADPSRATGRWQRTADGYRILIAVDAGRVLEPGTAFQMNLVVNEMYPNRSRRAGQLALAGGGGFVYLRGDREYPWLAAQAKVT
jgi:hypothetical protein